MAGTTSADPVAKLQSDIQAAQVSINPLQTGVRLTGLRDVGEKGAFTKPGLRGLDHQASFKWNGSHYL
jgi:hypothetical protein